MRVFHCQEIKEEAHVGAARRAVQRYASRLGFGEEALAELAIVVQEIGTNAVRYATLGGCLNWTTTLTGTRLGLELFYCDKGPGIYDLDAAFRDGVSTGGSLGTGFGAMRRLLDEFDAYSIVKGTTRRLVAPQRRTTHGTAMLGRKWPGGRPDEAARSRAQGRVGVWSRPRPGEEVNGDAYFISELGDETLLAVVDGLGHGRGARDASSAALSALEGWEGEPLDEVVLSVHDALRTTRGAVMGAVIINRSRGTFTYAGVGNVEVRVLGSPEPARPVPANGTLGARLTQVRVWPHRWVEGSTLVLASDGVSATWDPDSYPGILGRSPQILAGVLMRDFGRHSDDATVLVYR
jgi:anti-sigma regulatory factor (Ser/Thr protein kinase)